MSDKSIWSYISGLISGGRPATRTSRSETVCPKGHPMDPSWTSCPRCDAESRAQEKSSADAASMTFRENVDRSSAMSRNATITPGSMPNPDPAATRLDAGDEYAPARPRAASARRKITGVLVTFSWERQGDLFILYEGRNVIGKGDVESEGGRPCDVLLLTDGTMSDEHAVILCRAGRYELFDRQSTNGTFADGGFVESTGVELKDGAKIKTGETVWLFRKIESDAAGAAAGPSHRDEPRERPSPGEQSRVL
jgi:hypothetical protein